MKTKEEPNAPKEKFETLSRKLADLSEEESKQVTGGGIPLKNYIPGQVVNDCNGALNSIYTECINPKKKGSLNNCAFCRFNK